MPPKKRKQSQLDNETYVPRPPQKRAKKTADTGSSRYKKNAVQSPSTTRQPTLPKDPRAALVEIESKFSAAISERRKVSACLNDTLQHRTNLIRTRDWARAAGIKNSANISEAEAKLAVAEDEVARAKEWYREMWAVENKLGEDFNRLTAEVKALDQAKVFNVRGGRVEVATRTSSLWG